MIFTLLGRRETAMPHIMDIQRDYVIQEGAIAVTTFSLVQTHISKRYALDSILYFFWSQFI